MHYKMTQCVTIKERGVQLITAKFGGSKITPFSSWPLITTLYNPLYSIRHDCLVLVIYVYHLCISSMYIIYVYTSMWIYHLCNMHNQLFSNIWSTYLKNLINEVQVKGLSLCEMIPNNI